VAANSTSYKSVSLLVGVGESTFTAWLGNKYRGDNDKIDEKVAIWLKNEASITRQKKVLPADIKFAPTRSAQKFLAVLEHAQALPDVVVIAGGAGVGKSTACLQYKATHPNVWILTAEPSISSAYAMLEYLRETLGIPEVAPHKVSRAITIKLTGTQGLVIIDEAQHLAPKTIDQMRCVYDRAGIGLALVGNEEVWSRIDGGGRKADMAQLFSRVGMRITVARPTKKDIEAMLDASDIADAKQRLTLQTIAGKPGALRGMAKTLRIARMLALGADQPLSEEHIRAAYSRLSGGEDGAA
jgi:DNA transposition AAA+ family ATPase